MYYGVELSDVYKRKVSFRQAGVYIARLPPESATMTSIRLDSPVSDAGKRVDPIAAINAPWSAEEMLTAQVIDELRHLRYTVETFAAGKDAGKVPVPENVVRPGVEPKHSDAKQNGAKRTSLTAEQRRALDPRLRPGTGFEFVDGSG